MKADASPHAAKAELELLAQKLGDRMRFLEEWTA